MFSTGAVSREAEDTHLTTGNEQQLKRAGGVLDWGLPSLLKWVPLPSWPSWRTLLLQTDQNKELQTQDLTQQKLMDYVKVENEHLIPHLKKTRL